MQYTIWISCGYDVQWFGRCAASHNTFAVLIWHMPVVKPASMQVVRLGLLLLSIALNLLGRYERRFIWASLSISSSSLPWLLKPTQEFLLLQMNVMSGIHFWLIYVLHFTSRIFSPMWQIKLEKCANIAYRHKPIQSSHRNFAKVGPSVLYTETIITIIVIMWLYILFSIASTCLH